jgi:tetratricopeptide (TPR) repeat protein
MQTGSPHVQYAPPIGECPAITAVDEPLTKGSAMSMKSARHTLANKVLKLIMSPVCTAAERLNAAKRVITIADQAVPNRQGEVLVEASKLLDTLELPRQYEPVCQYYRALAIASFGKGNDNEALRLLKTLSHRASDSLNARCYLSAGTILLRNGDLNEARRLYAEATRACLITDNQYIAFLISLNLAMVSSLEGNNRDCLKILELERQRAMLIKSVSPVAYLTYLNTFAVEKCEAGHIIEALSLIREPLASPFAATYPEWEETYNETAAKSRLASRSTVALGRWRDEQGTADDKDNLIPLPAGKTSESDNVASSGNETARVLVFKPKIEAENQPDELPPIESKPLECEPEGDTEYIIKYSPIRTLTLRFMGNAGQERLKLEIRHDPDGAVADIWVRDKEGNSHSFFSACFLD